MIVKSISLYLMINKGIIQQQIQLNYDKIKADVQNIVDMEIVRIKADESLAHLINKE